MTRIRLRCPEERDAAKPGFAFGFRGVCSVAREARGPNGVLLGEGDTPEDVERQRPIGIERCAGKPLGPLDVALGDRVARDPKHQVPRFRLVPDGLEGERVDARPPTLVAVLKPDHIRDVDLFVGRYGARAFGPELFWRTDIPETELEPIWPGNELPGGLVALYDGRGRNETPLWLPEQRALVFSDGLTAPDGELRVWGTPWHEERAVPALRALLEYPFEHVIVSHGEPVHDRAAYERALELPPWDGE